MSREYLLNHLHVYLIQFLIQFCPTSPEICKSVDDDSKDEVEDDDDDNEEEEDVVENPDHEEGIFARGLAQYVTYPSSVPQTLKSSSKN